MRGIELNFLKKGAEFGGIFEEQNEGKNSLSIHNQDVALSAKSFRIPWATQMAPIFMITVKRQMILTVRPSIVSAHISAQFKTNLDELKNQTQYPTACQNHSGASN